MTLYDDDERRDELIFVLCRWVFTIKTAVEFFYFFYSTHSQICIHSVNFQSHFNV